MDVMNKPYIQCTLTIIVISFLWTPAISRCGQLETKGYTVPSGDITLEEGELLNITCTLNPDILATTPNASSRLYFSRSGEKLPDQMIDVLNSTSIRLSVVPTVTSDVNYYCYYNESEQYPQELVCLNVVVVGVSPKPVTDFSCISPNYESFNCSWTPPENYVKTGYNLTYVFKARANRNRTDAFRYKQKGIVRNHSRKEGSFRYRCPEIKVGSSKLYCVWDLSTTPIYRQAQETIYFMLFTTNTFGNFTNNYTIEHFKWLYPNPPEQLKNINQTTHSIALNWTIPLPLRTFPRGLQHRILYQSQFDNKWRLGALFKTKSDHGKNVIYNLTHLSYAHALYDIRVSMKSAVADEDNESLWSENATITVMTQSKIPDCAPETTSGSFEIFSTNGDTRDIYVYWKHILDYQQNGENFTYKVEVEGHPEIKHNVSKTYAKFYSLPSKKDCTINIWSKNEEGLSLQKSAIIIPSQRISEPQHFIKVERGGDNYELSWNHPLNVDRTNPVTNYTIFWCNSEKDRPHLCNGLLSWTIVPSNMERFNKMLPKPKNVYQFAIAANTYTASSEMIWATCTMIHQGIPGQMKNVWINDVGSDFIEIAWKINCNDAIDIVKGFIIFYCPVVSLARDVCKDGEKNVTIEGDKNLQIGRVTNLKPHSIYRLSVAAKINDSHYSLQSEPMYNTTNEAAPSTPPLNVTIYNITDSSITIRWFQPAVINGILKYYKIHYNNKISEFGVSKENITKYTLTDLMSYENYSISIEACTVNCSSPSPTQIVTTKIGTPTRIKKPYVSAIQNDSIEIEWNRPYPARGPINYYQLKFMGKSGDEYQLKNMINVSSHRYKIDSCGDSGSFLIAVRAVNIIDDEHRHGEWSDSLEAQCSQHNVFFYGIIIVLIVPLAVGVFFGLKKCYVMYKNMQNIEVKLPPGLDPVNPWNSEKHPEDIDHQSRADQALLLGKIPSGESSGCSSGHESITSSESPTQASNSDSGTEQPTSLTDENIRFRKNVSSKGYVLPDAITWGSNKPAPMPASNYCVLGVDPTSNQPQTDTAYVSTTDTGANLTMPYLSNPTTLPSPYITTGSDFVKTQNPNYQPYMPNEPITADKNNAYVVAGLTKDLLVGDILSPEENPVYIKGSEFAPNIPLSWQIPQDLKSKTGYVSVGDAMPPKTNKDGYVPHRHFEPKSLKED